MNKATWHKVYVGRSITWVILLGVYYNIISNLHITNILVILLLFVLIIGGMDLFGWLDYKIGTGQRENVVNARLNPEWREVYNSVIKPPNGGQ